MAEQVQLRLEDTIEELEEMVRVNLFTPKEVRCIIKRRKHLEYKIHRLAKTKQDFLRYIEYEINVLDLVRKRRKEIGYMYKKKEIDYSISNRINQLFRNVEYRHQYEVEIWLKHIQFCKKVRQFALVSRIYIRMLQVHSNKPELWVAAATWEADENKSIDTARKLLLRGLRFLPDSKLLYLECFRLELQHVDKIQKRRAVLVGSEEVADQVLNCGVALAVYTDAVAKITDPEFHTSFVVVCEEFDFAEELEEQIMADVRERFCTDKRLRDEEIVWDFCAKRHLTKAVKDKTNLNEAVDSCVSLLASALRTVSTGQMVSRVIETCLEKRKDALFTSFADQFYNGALDAFDHGHEKNYLSQDLYLKWVSLVEAEEKEKVIQLALDAYPRSECVWVMRIKHEISTGSSEKEIRSAFNTAAQQVDFENTLSIWYLAIEWALTIKPEKAVDLLKKTLSIPSQNIARKIKPLYLDLAVLILGMKEARKIYDKIRWDPPILESFFWKMFHYESGQPKHDVKDLRKILEDIITHFGKTSVDVWLKYVKLEKERGNAELVPKIHWRAMKILDPALEVEYMNALTLMNAGFKYE